MSTEPKIDLGGFNIKEWSLIILVVILGIAVTVFVIGFVSAMLNNPDITVDGNLDIGQYSGIIIGISVVAVTLVAQQLTAKNQAAAVKATDDAWIKSESLAINPPGDPNSRINFKMPELYAKTLLISTYIQKIYSSDSQLTPSEQQEAVQAYEGLTAAEMQALIPLTGPKLAESIRKIISDHRARNNRTYKDKN